VSENNLFQAESGGCAHVEHNGERGAGAAAAANGQRRGTEPSRRDVPPITMTAVWVAVLSGVLLLCLGVLVGASWTDQALGQRHRRLANERRELNEWHRMLEETSQGCIRCGNRIARAAGDHSGVGGRVNSVSARR
jgi:cell division protein FtsL